MPLDRRNDLQRFGDSARAWALAALLAAAVSLWAGAIGLLLRAD